jgi:ferric enterobactin receptor
MKKIILLITVIIIGINVYAQMPQGMPGNKAGMKGPGNIGHVYGKLIDQDGKPVNGASILMMETKMDTATKKMKQFLLSGMITKSNGDFDFEEQATVKDQQQWL